ncbi:ATP-binding protein [Micromonospora sp. WMMA1363]|uniref:sensor histidine kinase n=1 Tax=Micromonospora sp. WMMA1363 TaxID=3053985 RepID=UPI00259D14CB|nr:ATP-binding protein [Micromonospora sp. WMMA1363]MDM4721401.1 ATP-binding protein [Micromonospora sp. WMMA1363]
MARPSLRLTFSLLFASVAALVAVGVGALSYGLASTLIWRETDDHFDRAAETVAELTIDAGDLTPEDLAEPDEYEVNLGDLLAGSDTLIGQILGPGGQVVDEGYPRPLPVSYTDRTVAASEEPGRTRISEAEVDGTRVRIITVSLGGGRGAIQVAQQLSEVDGLLTSLRTRIMAVGVAVSVAAGVCGWFVAGRVTRGLVRLTRVAEEVALTGRLDLPVPAGGRDEVGRLGAAFDTMLGQLARSKDAQQRLVQEAGHELRTPLTSLRTNIALLHRFDELPLAARGPLLTDLTVESRELINLVNELVELATDTRELEAAEPVDLTEIAEKVAQRFRTRSGREIIVRADAAAVTGRPQALERALANLVENATKFDSSGGPVEIVIRRGRVEVRDRGPGVPDLPEGRLFDRFYRAPEARRMRGSGLGLAIVRDVVTAHDGTVFARNREGGGAVIGFELPERWPD